MATARPVELSIEDNTRALGASIRAVRAAQVAGVKGPVAFTVPAPSPEGRAFLQAAKYNAHADSIPFDLSPLPGGFHAAVVRAYSASARPWPLDALAFALGEAWRNSTTKQRLAAEAGVCQVMTSALGGADQRSASYVVGVLGASCIDLELSRVVDVAAMDPEAVLCGVFDAGGLRAAEDVRGVLARFMEAAHERTIKMRAFAGALDRGDVPRK